MIAPELSTSSSITCGGFGGSPPNYYHGAWATSWLGPLFQYYSSYYDVVSIHGYNQEPTDKANILEVWNSYDYGKPVWLDETAYTSTSSLTAICVD